MPTQMTKSQLIEKIAQLRELAKKDVKGMMEALAEVGYKELKKNGVFVVPGFAKFVVVEVFFVEIIIECFTDRIGLAVLIDLFVTQRAEPVFSGRPLLLQHGPLSRTPAPRAPGDQLEPSMETRRVPKYTLAFATRPFLKSSRSIRSDPDPSNGFSHPRIAR